MDKGVYILLLKNDECRILTGALGEITFPAGWYGYVGSAQGPGGFSRVLRHFRLSINKDKNSRWHIDYLLLSPYFQVIRAYCIQTEERAECLLARGMPGIVIPGFGSSDCTCRGHLFYFTDDPDENIQSLALSLPEKEDFAAHIEILIPDRTWIGP